MFSRALCSAVVAIVVCCCAWFVCCASAPGVPPLNVDGDGSAADCTDDGAADAVSEGNRSRG